MTTEIPGGYTFLVCPAGDGNPRNTEGSIIELKDGRLLLAYSHFYGGAEDHAGARIVGKLSCDVGKTWSDGFVVQENVGKENVMSVTLLRLRSGKIALFYGVKNACNDLRFDMRISSDEAMSWGEPVRCTPLPGYHVMNNDRAIQLASGRLIAPVSFSPDCNAVNHWVSSCFLSDDEGRTWRHSASQLDVPKRGAMEPGVVERADGSLFMIIRTQLGRIYTSVSTDGGDHWSEAERSEIVSPEAPATIKRIPGSDDLLLVWNNNLSETESHNGNRTPLTAAISKDGGISWSKPRDIETDPNRRFAYTSILFTGKMALLTYYDSPGWEPLSLRLRAIPVEWLRGER